MPTCTDPSTTPRDHLGVVIAAIEEAHHSAEGAVASLVRVAGLDGPEVELALLPVASGDVVDLLLGAVTPDEWEAAGVVVDGTARDLAPDTGTVGPRRGPIRVALLCDRRGATASVLRREGQEPIHDASEPGEAGPGGRIADAVRRSLGVATAPPSTPVERAVVDVWLHRVLTLAVRGTPVDVALVESLRPASPPSWRALREQCAASTWVELECPADLAGWMDDGMFSRWCAAAFPEPLEVLVELSELVPAEAVEHLAEAVYRIRSV